MHSSTLKPKAFRINAMLGALIVLAGLISPATFGPAPAKANAIQAAVIVDAGGDEYEYASHTCVLKNSAVECVGSGLAGQLGNGFSVSSATPVKVVGLSSGVTAIELGQYHSCAIVSDQVKCWGANNVGQLGDGTTTRSSVPVAVVGLTGVTSLQVGSNHACATWTSAQKSGVKCWGNNDFGQLGNGVDYDNPDYSDFSSTPVPVIDLSDGSGLALGMQHSCALIANAVKCWGDNANGYLGNGSTTNSFVPVHVLGLGDVTAIAAGAWNTCALNSLGGVKCWGWGKEGAVGDGSNALNNPIPVQVTGLASGVTAIDAGQYHSCAVLSSGLVKCWGSNHMGQLGDGTTQDQSEPVQVLNRSGITGISLGNNFTCATTIDDVNCWGSNSYNQLVNGLTNWFAWSNEQDLAETPSGQIVGLPLVSSADGLKLFTGYGKSLPNNSYGVFIKRSLDGGLTFSETEVASFSNVARLSSGEIAISDTGEKLTLAFSVYDINYNSFSYAYRSNDYGVSWSELDLNSPLVEGARLTGVGQPKAKMSLDGNVIALAFTNGETTNIVVTSQDGGQSFVSRDFFSYSVPAEIAMNGDGSLIGVVTRANDGFNARLKFHKSTNQGLSWSDQDLTASTTNVASFGIAISNDRLSDENFVVVDYFDQNEVSGYITTSSDSGSTFSQTSNLTTFLGTEGVADIRFDGLSTWIALVNGGFSNSYQAIVVKSTDQGQTWNPSRAIPLGGKVTRSGDLQVVGQTTYALLSLYTDRNSTNSSVGILSSNDFGTTWSALTTLGTGSFDSFMYEDLSQPNVAIAQSTSNVYALWTSKVGNGEKLKFNSRSLPTSTDSPGGDSSSDGGSPVAAAPAPSFTINSRPLVSTKGQTLTLNGANLGDVTVVRVGGKEAKIVRKSDGEIVIDVPEGFEGYPDVEVVSSSGTNTIQGLLKVVKPYAAKRTQKITQFSGNLPTKAATASLKKMYLKSTTANLLTCVSTVASNATPSQVAKAKTQAKATCQSVVEYSKFIKSADVQVSKTGKAGSKPVLAVTFDRTLSGN